MKEMGLLLGLIVGILYLLESALGVFSGAFKAIPFIGTFAVPILGLVFVLAGIKFMGSVVSNLTSMNPEKIGMSLIVIALVLGGVNMVASGLGFGAFLFPSWVVALLNGLAALGIVLKAYSLWA